jgi:hypothetical protein
MTDPITLTIILGGSLIACGYILGRSDGWRRGFDDVLKELIASKIVEPMEVLRHYANMGNQRAQAALEKLNAERKAKFNARNDAKD